MRGQLSRVGTCVAIVALALAPATGSAQGGSGGATGIVVGQVSDKDLQQPVAQAQVMVVGTGQVVRTSDDGHFRLVNVAPGAIDVRAMRLGYSTLTLHVVVGTGAPTVANFSLARLAQTLNAIVSTATSEATSRRETGANIAVVQADSIPQASLTDFSDMLTSRTPGVVVEHASGETGTGSSIRIRGTSSLYLSNEPIYFIDGIRLDNTPYTTNLSLGGQSPSRVDDIPDYEIETYEVLKGPTASALYGTAAANGIISITTKHGQEGRTQWDAYAEGSNIQNATHFPPNWGTLTQDFSPNIPGYPEATDCSLNYQAAYIDDGGANSGGCLADSTNGRGGIVTYNPLAAHSPYRIGQRADLGVSASGGSGTTTFFLSGTKASETGVFPNNSLNKANLRVNANFQLTPQLGVAVTAGYLTNKIQLPQNDNGYYGPLSDGYLGYPVGNTQDGHGHPSFGYNPVPPDQSQRIFDGQGLDHYTAGGTLSYHPFEWLTITGVTGIDQNFQGDNEIQPQNAVFALATDSLGHVYTFKTVTQSLTDNVAATVTTHPFSSLTSKTTAGFQYYEFYQTYLTGQAQNLTPGISSLHGANQNPFTDDTTSQIKQIGVLGSEELNWKDRRYLTFSVRADFNSSFGAAVKSQLYPSVNSSWVMSDEDFWPRNPTVSSLRLHAAYGTSGLAPQDKTAITYFTGGVTKFNGVENAGVTVANLGSQNLTIERSNEVEGGAEWGFFKDRVTFDATTYYKYTSHVLVQVPLAGSAGGPTTQLANLGSAQNFGIELGLNAQIVRSDAFAFDVAMNFAGNQNRLLSLGQGVTAPVIFGYGQQFHRGYPEGGYWAQPLIDPPSQPSNGLSGLENAGAVGLGDYAFRGPTNPVRNASFSPTFTFFRHLRVSTNFEYRGGYKQFDASEQFRCSFGTCRGNNDPTDSWNDKVCAAAAVNTAGNFQDCWIENADFIKWRELSIAYTLPDRWAHVVRAQAITVSAAARNLLTVWTLWKGVDPEIDSFGQDNFARYQFGAQPLTRYLTLRLNVNY
jgi:TonB-dependent starch-binding outer membrane protein SusC